MPYKASHMYAQVTPRKARLLVDMVRGINVNVALDALQFSPQRTAGLLRAVIQSALANAGQAQGVNLNKLVVAQAYVNEGPRIKRGRPVARGRHHRIIKCTSHIHVVLDESAAPAGAESKAEPASAGGRV
jgi:large subunit ribosomal protein L22